MKFTVATESQCMKTIRTHLVDKSNFMLSDHKTRCKSFQQFQQILYMSAPFYTDFNYHTYQRSYELRMTDLGC